MAFQAWNFRIYLKLVFVVCMHNKPDPKSEYQPNKKDNFSKVFKLLL